MKNWSLSKVLIFYGFVGAIMWLSSIVFVMWAVRWISQF